VSRPRFLVVDDVSGRMRDDMTVFILKRP